MADRKRAVVIGNCQAFPLANALSVQSRDTQFEAFSLHTIPEAEREERISELIAQPLDLVLSVPLSTDWGPLSGGTIRQAFGATPTVLISNIHYDGLHPDLIYVGGMLHRLVGPLRDYHSRICLIAYLRGFDPGVTRTLFRAGVYERLGYFAQHDKSVAELTWRDAGVDVSVKDILLDAIRRELCFFSVNHPTAALFSRYSAAILRHLEAHGLATRADAILSPLFFPNPLAENAIFPIYPEIARHHAVAELGSYWFKPEGQAAGLLDLSEFIAGEFAAFRAADQAALRSLPIAAAVLEQSDALW